MYIDSSILTNPTLRNLEMTLKIHLFSPKTLPHSQNFQSYPKIEILCAVNKKKKNNKLIDAELASI